MTEQAERLDSRTPNRRPAWDFHRMQVVILVLGLLALTPMTWREKTVTNLEPTSWRGLRLDLVPAGLLLYLSIALAVAVAVAVLRSGGRRPLVLSAAGVVTMAALLLSRPGDSSATFNGFTQVTHYQWSGPPLLSLVFWLLLLAITSKVWRTEGKSEPLHRAVVFGCGIALLVLMTAGWLRWSAADLATGTTTGFGLFDGPPWPAQVILAVPVVLMALLILLPPRKVVTAVVAAVGLVLTLAIFGLFESISRGLQSYDVGRLPAAYLSVLAWLIALAAAVHARVAKRR